MRMYSIEANLFMEFSVLLKFDSYKCVKSGEREKFLIHILFEAFSLFVCVQVKSHKCFPNEQFIVSNVNAKFFFGFFKFFSMIKRCPDIISPVIIPPYKFYGENMTKTLGKLIPFEFWTYPKSATDTILGVCTPPPTPLVF